MWLFWGGVSTVLATASKKSKNNIGRCTNHTLKAFLYNNTQSCVELFIKAASAKDRIYETIVKSSDKEYRKFLLSYEYAMNPSWIKRERPALTIEKNTCYKIKLLPKKSFSFKSGDSLVVISNNKQFKIKQDSIVRLGEQQYSCHKDEVLIDIQPLKNYVRE